MGSLTLLPMTPLYTPPYILDEVHSAAERGDLGYEWLTASVYDACKRRGVRGHLNPQTIDEMVANYDPDEREARAFGKFQFFSQKVYGRLNKELHFVDPKDYPIPEGSEFRQIVDPHDGRPPAAIWMATTPSGRRIIFDEYPIRKDKPYWEMDNRVTAEEFIRDCILIENRWGLATPRRMIDKRFGFQTRGGTNLATQYMQAGKKLAQEMFTNKSFIYNKSYDIKYKDGEIAFGHDAVTDALKAMDDGKPGLVIYNTCMHTWNGMDKYIRKHETGKGSFDKAKATSKLVEKYKDFPDVVRYGVCDKGTAGSYGNMKRERKAVRASRYRNKRHVYGNSPMSAI
jgi:hypothetical protein